MCSRRICAARRAVGLEPPALCPAPACLAKTREGSTVGRDADPGHFRLEDFQLGEFLLAEAFLRHLPLAA